MYGKKRDYARSGDGGSKELIIYVFQFAMSLVVVFMNFLIEMYIFVSTKFERQSTNTYNELSILYKMTFLKVMNTVLVTSVGNTAEKEWFKNHGLVEEVVFVVIFMNFGEIFRVIFNFEFISKWIQRTIESRKGEKSLITQNTANSLYENDATIVGKTMSVLLVF